MNLSKTNALILVVGLICSGLQSAQAQDYNIIGKHIYGMILDSDQDPLLRNQRAEIYQQPDSALGVNYGKATFSADAFSQSVGAIYLTKLDVDHGNPITTVPVDSSPVNGISVPTAGVPTQWGSVLFTEASLVDSADPEQFTKQFQAYFKNDAGKVNPYEYGWPLEMVVLNEKGESKLIKNYAMGRMAAQKILLMPDQKSVWMLSSNGAGYLYLFVAEDERNLSKGQLFVADTTHHPVRLLPLSHTSTLKAKYQLKKIEFSDLFERQDADQGHCNSPYTSADTVYGIECLKIKDKRNAGLFEPHRYAAVSGVKPEFALFDDIQFDSDANKLTLSDKSGQNIEFSLGPVAAMPSDYVIKERL